MTKETYEEIRDDELGRKEAKKALWFGLGAIAAGFIPVAGLVLGKIAMDHGEKSRKISDHTKRGMGLLGILLGGLGFFLNLLTIGSIITVVFLQATNILELGAM